MHYLTCRFIGQKNNFLSRGLLALKENKTSHDLGFIESVVFLKLFIITRFSLSIVPLVKAKGLILLALRLNLYDCVSFLCFCLWFSLISTCNHLGLSKINFN